MKQGRWARQADRGVLVVIAALMLAGCGAASATAGVPSSPAGTRTTASVSTRAASVSTLAAATNASLATTSPAAAPVERAITLAGTQTAVAQGTPRAPTPTFQPTTPTPPIATTAAIPIQSPLPTRTGTPPPRVGTAQSLPVPSSAGELVMANGHRLWIACQGQGGPTVVMEAGVTTGSQIWQFVAPGVATFTRVCVYDRANLGRSDAAPRPRTSQDVVDDLHMLLTNAGVPGPYVLVAHSFGGLQVRLYASEYPRDVVGMVLVDTVHEDRFVATARVLTPDQEMDFEQRREANTERLDYYGSSDEVRSIGKPLPNLPLTVIARGRASTDWPPGYPVDALEQIWRQLQTDLVSRAPQGVLVIADQSDHNIPGEQPQLIVDATRRVCDAARGR